MHKLRIYPKKLFWRLYIVVLILSLGLDFYWLYRHVFHYHFDFQEIPQFFALFGLFGCMLLILIAKGMGIFLVVDEDYYQKRERKGN
jgi:hypothetical protein